MDKEETLEEFVKRVSPSTKLYLYNSNNASFLSNESLDKLYGDMFFIESRIRGKDEKSFNLQISKEIGYGEYLVDYDSSRPLDILKHKIRDLAYWKAPAIRTGLVKCLMAEPFFPFQETMNYTLAMDSVKIELKKRGTVLLSCLDGQLFHCCL